MTAAKVSAPLPSGLAPACAADAPRLGLWFLALIAVSAIRLIVAASHPHFETECYYWLWSRRLSLGYFDHPPMLAWMIRLFDWFGPPSPLAARLHAVVSYFAASLILYFWARNLFGSPRIAVRSVILFNLVPIYSIGSIQNQPDLPLILFWCLALLCFERALSKGGGWWAAFGVAAGGALLSKFHAVVLLGGLGLHLFVSRQDRRWLRNPWPYVAAIVVCLVYSPNFWWNATHRWMTYTFQLLRHAEGSRFEVKHLLATLAGPFGYLSPWLAWVMFAAAYLAWREGVRKGHRGLALVFWSSAPLFLFFVFMSCRKLVKLHWPAVAFVGLCPAVAYLLEQWRPKARAALYAATGALTVLAYAYLVYPYPLSRTLPGSWLPQKLRLDETKTLEEDWAGHLYGLKELGAFMRQEMDAMGTEAPCLIMSQRFDRVALAAFYAERPEAAYVPHPNPDFGDPRGFLAWHVEGANQGANAIYIFRDESEKRNKAAKRRETELEELRKIFDSVSEQVSLDVPYRGHTLRRWTIVRCRGFRGESSEAAGPRQGD